jgi:hypothetical protein
MQARRAKHCMFLDRHSFSITVHSKSLSLGRHQTQKANRQRLRSNMDTSPISPRHHEHSLVHHHDNGAGKMMTEQNKRNDFDFCGQFACFSFSQFDVLRVVMWLCGEHLASALFRLYFWNFLLCVAVLRRIMLQRTIYSMYRITRRNSKQNPYFCSPARY